MTELADTATTPVRVDVWLWAARFFKTRSLAKQAIAGGKVGVNDMGCKPAKTVRAGDRLTIHRGEERWEVEVLALAEKRGPASVAQTLYRETEASAAARLALREQQQLGSTGLLRPPGRPDKRSRRHIHQFKERQS
jgi:ribosome-associated heat shock protein Hsp15